MIILDPTQTLALRKSASGPVDVTGRGGTGKSVLANAIASDAARAGKACLLVGASSILDRPIGYAVIREVHRVLTDRAQLTHLPSSSGPRPPQEADPIEARMRSNPAAARVAARTLQQAQEIAKVHGLTPAEVEESIVSERTLTSQATNSLSLATQDASRIADMLWSGNARTGRTLKDVDEVVAGRPVEVPPNEEALGLIVANDREYEVALTKLVSRRQEAKEERQVSGAVASLLRPRSSDKTLSEYHKYASFMARTVASAITLIKRHANFEAALTAANGNDAAKAIEYFMRMRPNQGVGAAVKTFEAALQDYRHDVALLEPLLAGYGNRTLGSFGPGATAQDDLPQHDIGSLVQKLREARYAARHLPAHLGTLRAALPKSLFERIRNAPIEEAPTVVGTAGAPDPRSKAAGDLRQLRDLFASTGFGDLLKAPEDFARLIEQAAAEKVDDQPSDPSPSPEVLDLLLEFTTMVETQPALAWPASVTRAKTAREAVEAIHRGRFDVVVVDDAALLSAEQTGEIQRSGATVHRLGLASEYDAMSLEIPHRQTEAAVAAAASGQPGRWLGAPGGLGVVVRTDPALSLAQLSGAAGRLVSELFRRGCSATLSSSGQAADIIVAVADELRDADLTAAAENAAQGVVALCRADGRSPTASIEQSPTADVKSAQALGWSISRSTIEGTVVEKDGRLTALLNEAVAASPRDETIADVCRRLEILGWRPVVVWNGAERSSHDLGNLLATHSVATAPNPIRKIVDEFDLHDPSPSGGGSSPDSGDQQSDATGPGEATTSSPLPVDATADVAATLPENDAGQSDPENLTAEAASSISAECPDYSSASETADAAASEEQQEGSFDGAGQPLERESPPSQGTENAVRADAAPPDLSPSDGREHSESEAAAVETATAVDEARGEDSAEKASGQLTKESGALAPAIPRQQAIFRDRRGARKPSAQKDSDAPQRERRAARLRQADARLRLLVDRIRKRVGLAVVLLKPEGFPEEADIDGTSVLAFESRYDDIDQEWSNVLLDDEFRLRDGAQGLEWIRGARPFHLFAGLPGETGLMSISAAPLAGDCTIVCRARDIEAIAAAAAEAGSPELRRLGDFEGIPSEWVVLEGYAPVRALTDLPEWLKPLDPGANIVIALSDSFEVRHATYAEGGAPFVRIEGMPGNCQVFIDDAPAERQEDGSWTAPGWDAPGQHRVMVVPGPSRSYNVMPDPARCNGWEPWSAHDNVVPLLSGSAAVCGAMVFCPDGRTVLATEPASSVIALGVQHEINSLAVRRDAPAAIAALPFEPLFAILSSGGRRDSNRILALDFPATAAKHKPRKFDNRWVSTIREMAARRVPVRPATPAAKAAWRSITKEARRWRRVR
ncbi:hypothetical protein JJC00_32250 [Bradyrhizobium diazoefficiens]|uniref:hypothetical protein n=1 Tax=Bradyrhizobium diazoefficiens TaxID=1355477 RepID=UPI00190C93C6|nr:hypothetical protein [Bradyrhizobium diazoefficiens]QQO33159.1 hypothetical protein JJC00_32250 [Bradyrhizobium diazoefficiens]